MRAPPLLALLAVLGCRGNPPDDTSLDVDADGDGITAASDCNDADPSVLPGAPEVCDGVDNNCDGGIDELDPANDFTFYADADADGYGDAAATEQRCFPAEGQVTDASDCDDADADVHPGAPETDCADPIDYNCDGSVGYADVDADGHAACVDCDDADAGAFPGGTETPYDGADNDCDALTPDDDLDADGFVAADDCDDAAPDVHPDAAETPYDGIDNDCDEATSDTDVDGDGVAFADGDCDDEDASVFPGNVEIPYNAIDDDCEIATADDDLDADGVSGGDDCDDEDPNAYPGNVETPYDGADNDCDPSTRDDDLDEDGYGADTDCDDAEPLAHPDTFEVVYDGIDNDCDPSTKDDDLDGDGYVAAADCDDDQGAVHPGATEKPYDGLDNDCDPTSKDDDLDGDGHIQADDCDETDATVFPGASEKCNGVDDDCDGAVDNDTSKVDWWRDADGDGYGAAGTSDKKNDCAKPPGYIDNQQDCDDGDPKIKPGATETWYDGIDQDCSGGSDYDKDGDGEDKIATGKDCNDDDKSVIACGLDDKHPGESCKALKADYPSLPTADYWVDGGLSAALKVRCDMTTQGGGWMVVNPCDAKDVWKGKITAKITGTVAEWTSGCRYRTQDRGGDHSYTWDFDVPMGYGEFLLHDYEARAFAYSSSYVSDLGYLMTSWSPIAPSGGWSDIGFGSPTKSARTTSFANEGASRQCTSCLIPWPKNDKIYAIGGSSTQFRIAWGEVGGEWEGWYPWYSGSIYVR